jgi:UDP-glucose 4-epimerase
MKVLVTGGAGFIGKHLVRSLLEKGHTITIFDDFSNSSEEAISALIDRGVKVIKGDITVPIEIKNAIKNKEIVIHLAAKTSVSESIKNPLETFQVNVNGTRNVLTACEKNKIQKLIVASSAAVYKECSMEDKLTEKSQTNPISPYGESKLLMEKEIEKNIVGNNINCVILRFFNIYGLGQTSDYAGVITKFIENIKAKKSLIIHGDGKQERDFIYIEDIINAINLSMKKCDGKKGEIYNVASGKSISVLDLAKLLIKISNEKIDLKFVDSRSGDIRISRASIEKISKELDFKILNKLENGLLNLIN